MYNVILISQSQMNDKYTERKDFKVKYLSESWIT